VRVRHRIPSVFSLAMVDVLCCTLGCVILLWLLNAKQTEEAAQEREETRFLLTSAQAERDRARAELTRTQESRQGAYALLAELEGQLRSLEDNRAGLRRQVESQEKSAKALAGELKLARGRVLALEGRVAAEEASARDLAGQLKAARARVAALEADAKSEAGLLAAERTRAGGLGRELAEAEGRVKALQADLDVARTRADAQEARSRVLEQGLARHRRELVALGRTVEELRSSQQALQRSLEARDRALALAAPYKGRWAQAQERSRGLAKDLFEAKQTVVALQGEKKTLQAAAENRLAGIELTGRRVIFLVDMSGSMEMLDEKTDAPAKWVEVRNTVARLMRSLPDLQKYQVIAFSSRATFPLGGAGRWLDHDPRGSPGQVLKALAAIKPKGGTNMYAALDSAFRYRAQGLDTIYLLSDGLPNVGEGLPKDVRGLKEVERGVILGKYIRKTLKGSWNAARAGQPRVRINTIGFFYESPDLGAFLWALAREHGGSFVGMSKP
jgi:hypothetical protein